MCSAWPITGNVKSASAPSARIAAIANEESSSSASIAPFAAMMAETPHTAEPTASKEVSLGRSLNARPSNVIRSEEHTSELQSRLHLVCRLLLEKKKKNERSS